MALSELRSEVLVCFAVKEEAAAFKKLAPALAAYGNPEILITGMGRKNSDRALSQRLSGNAPALVLTCGFAGALNPELKIGSVVFDADPEAGIAALLQAGAHPAKFHCAPRVATTVAEKTALRQSTGADAVEMESGIIRDICRRNKIPSATIRAISDTAHEALPLDFNALMTADDTLSFPRLAVALMKSPGKIPELMRLQKSTRFAAEKLAAVLSQLLRSRKRGT